MANGNNFLFGAPSIGGSVVFLLDFAWDGGFAFPYDSVEATFLPSPAKIFALELRAFLLLSKAYLPSDKSNLGTHTLVLMHKGILWLMKF